MEEKAERVFLWLKKMYENGPVPGYEVNAKTVDFLYNLAECSEARERDIALIIEDMSQRAAEYEAEAKYLQDLLGERLGLSLSSLSSESSSALNTLVSSATILETKDTSLNSLFSAINDSTLELYEVESENRELELELKKMKDKLTAVLVMEEQLKEDLKKSEEHLVFRKNRNDNKSQDLIFLEKKAKDLLLRTKNSEKQLAATGLDQSLTHESLVKMSEKLSNLQKELEPLKKRLESYGDLSPNLLLAKVAIEEAKRELNVMDEELSKEVNKMMSELPESSKWC